LMVEAAGDSWSKLARQARALRLVPPAADVLPLGSTKAREQLPNFGQQVFQVLRKATGDLPEVNRLSALLLPAELLPLDRVWLPATGETSSIPWEAACTNENYWIAHDPAISIVYRTQWNAHPLEDRLVAGRPSVLVITSMPRNLPSVNVELQHQRVSRLISRYPEATEGMFRWSTNRSLAAIRREIAEYGINILHVIAHGQSGKILWEDERQMALPLAAENFCAQLSAPSLQVVLLSVCDSASPPDGSRSLAAIAAAGLAPSVIGMRATLDELAAAIFTETFYESLLQHPRTALDQLVQAGRKALYVAAMSGDIGVGQWTMPALFLRDSAVRFGASHGQDSDEARAQQPAGTRTAAPYPARLRFPDGMCVPIAPTGTTLGRSHRADIPLEHWSTLPFQASIRWVTREYRLLNLGAGSGTLVNGNPVREKGLSDGDQIIIENFVFYFELGDTND
jgi:hypothetical protein